jgi:triosephosphate isomerase
MSRQKFVMGNWKMNGSHASVHALLQEIKGLRPETNTEVVVFPPFVFLEKACWELRNSHLRLGAQNISEFTNGPYTGEVSAAMVKGAGCHYVLIGHSERRQIMHETNEMIVQKCLRAVEADLRPVLCVGETKQQYEQKMTAKIVLAQLQSVLNLRDLRPYLSRLIVAYEPVWAIGTGLTATPHQAQEVHQLLRQTLIDDEPRLASIPIVYGGSVKVNNVKTLLAMPDIDGVLIGGASLNGQEFQEICHLIK